MKTIARVVNWLCIAFIVVAIVRMALRSQHSSGAATLLSLLPFASTLAALHFKPSKWFTAIALVTNLLFSLGILLFVVEAFAISSGQGSFLQVVAFAGVAVPSILNLFVLFPWRKQPRSATVG